MLFLISWSISQNSRVQCWNVFGNMTPADDLKDAGDDITIVGRWHKMGGSGGVCVCECSNVSSLNSWMLNWSPICEISCVPVVDDADARSALQGKPFFVSNTDVSAQSDDCCDSSGNCLDLSGNCCDSSGNWCDPSGNWRDSSGNSCDSSGNWCDPSGNCC